MSQMTIEQTFQIALQHQQAGRLPQAEQLYKQILSQRPRHVGALQYLGVVAHQVGRNDIAADLIRQALAIQPANAEACSNLGLALKELGQLDEAIASYRQALALKPDFPEAYINLGGALRDKGQLDESIAAYRQTIALRSNYPEAYCNLGMVLGDNGQLDEAIIAYRQAIVLNPNYPDAHSNLSSALRDKHQLDDAIAAARQAILLNAHLVEAYNNLGAALKDKGQLDEAVAAYRQAISLRPDFAEAYSNLGAALKDQGQLEEAIAVFRRAVALKPNYREVYSDMIYTMHFHHGYNPQTILQEHRPWHRQFADPLKQLIQISVNDRNPDRRMRIGYVSPDFRKHPIGRLTIPLLAHHDKTNVEVFAYSNAPGADAVTERLHSYTDGWRNIFGISDARTVDLIRHDKIDILVDLTLHMANNRLLVFARKPAPVQVTWLGYPSTTGLNTMDYRLSDPYMDPPGMNDQFYVEQTIRLADTFQLYDLVPKEVPVNPLPALERGFVTFGCLNNFCKINEPQLLLWTRILQQVKNSKLVLLTSPGSHQQRTRDFLMSHEIAPQRVIFPARPESHSGYMRLYHEIDVGLDPYPYNGHTTSMDSLWMGVPVVTLYGPMAISRAGLSQCSNLGLLELATDQPDNYVRIAAELAQDLPRLMNLRRNLRQMMRQSPLTDAPKFTRNIEAAYRRMWRTWCAASAV